MVEATIKVELSAIPGQPPWQGNNELQKFALLVAVGADPDWSADWKPLIFEKPSFDLKIKLPGNRKTLILAVRSKAYFPVIQEELRSKEFGEGYDKVVYKSPARLTKTEAFENSYPWNLDAPVDLNERNFRDYFSAVGLQLRLGFFSEDAPAGRLREVVSQNGEFFYKTDEAADLLSGFVAHAGDLPKSARHSLATAVMDMLDNKISSTSSPEDIPANFRAYAEIVKTLVFQSDFDEGSLGHVKRLARLYNDAGYFSNCMDLVQILDSIGFDATGQPSSLRTFLRTATECAQKYYVYKRHVVAKDPKAILGNVADGTDFIWKNKSDFVMSFIKLSEMVADVPEIARADDGVKFSELEKFVHYFCKADAGGVLDSCKGDEA